MTLTERQRILDYLRMKLDATDPNLDKSPLWQLLSATIADTLAGANDERIDLVLKAVKEHEGLGELRKTPPRNREHVYLP